MQRTDLTPPRSTLSMQVAEKLRERIISGEFAEHARLPSEATLATEHSVSRVTVRTALRSLEAQGLIVTRHGAGSFVAPFGSGIRTGLQELRSISQTIRELGRTPGMERRAHQVRTATSAERERLGLPAGAEVVDVQRRVLADGEPVAFSYDIIPLWVVPADRVDHLGLGSTFADFEAHGVVAVRAVAELHAVVDPEIGWGPGRPESGLYVLLDQMHYDKRGSAIDHSRTYFVEGRFQFVVMRTR